MALVTGQRWPIVGKRLVSEFPYIEGEVSNKLSLTLKQISLFTLKWNMCSLSLSLCLSGAVRYKGVRLHGHRRHRPPNAPGIPKRAGSGRSPATYRTDHGERAGLESGAENGTVLELQIFFFYKHILRFQVVISSH